LPATRRPSAAIASGWAIEPGTVASARATLAGGALSATLAAARRSASLATILLVGWARLGARDIFARTLRPSRQGQRGGSQVTRLVLLGQLRDQLAIGTPAAIAQARQDSLGQRLALALLELGHRRD